MKLNKINTSQIIVTLEHPHGKIEVELEEWIRVGPGQRELLQPISVYQKDSMKELPVRVIPLRYRNNVISRFLIRLGILSDPWEKKRN